MNEANAYGKTIAEAWHDSLLHLWFSDTKDCLPDTCSECSITIVVETPLAEPMISKLAYTTPMDLEQYRQEMLDGILDFEVFAGKWEYTYHGRYAWQYNSVIEELRKNPYSRRAVMDIRSERDVGSDDPACWQHVQFFIRDGRLECKTLFRSNDAVKAAYSNMFAIVQLQKKIADELGVPVGRYVHRANSYHCYRKDFAAFKGMVKRISGEDRSIYANYTGDWEEMMAEAKPEIEKKVKELVERCP